MDKRIKGGKYDGWRLADIPISYLAFCIEKNYYSFMHRDMRDVICQKIKVESMGMVEFTFMENKVKQLLRENMILKLELNDLQDRLAEFCPHSPEAEQLARDFLR